MGHSYGTLLWDTLKGHSCETLLWDTVAGHSCGTLFVGHSYGTLCGTLLWDTFVGHSCGTLLLGTLFVRDFLQKSRCEAARRAFPPSVTRQVSTTSISYETSSKSHTSSLQNERFVRDFLQKSHVKAPKRAFRTRLPQKVRHVKALQNERFVRDFLKNRHVKLCKTSVSYETSSQSQAETPIGAHPSCSPAKQFRDSSPSKQHPLTRQSQCDSDIHLYHNSQPHDSLRLPRIFPRPHV